MSTENLRNKEAVEKIQELVDAIDVCLFSTFRDGELFPYTTPMSRQEVDEEGNIWFLISSESETHDNLVEINKASLGFAHVEDFKFLTINGVVEISRDQQKIDQYWNKFIEAWFQKGKDDPTICVLKVSPEDAHYWDNKTNKLVTLLQVTASAITGKDMDIGREGDLKV